MGERLGRYAVLQHLASGGMADVLLGRSDGIEGFERHVVLKRIRAEHAKDQRFITMFLDEARVAANLHHQNIVQVYDIGEESGDYFFAMEYLHGEDLRKLLSAVSKTRGHMPLGLVCTIVSSAASGLHYAHERRDTKQKPLNIVHRDVSPSNILIGYDGAVKVVDFGIARAAMRQVETRSGSVKGKVAYMSPEQCKGEDIDRRSDVYALGVLLYELTTTTRLFKGDNDYLMMDAIVNGKVPLPRVRRPDLPNELSTIIMKALSVDRNRRYQTADELRVALDQFATKHNVNASASALATYMKKVFGSRPEPWLDTPPAGEAQGNIDAEGPTQAAGQSWVEVPRDSMVAGTSSLVGAATADTISPPISTRETRTSMKLGWELQDQAAGRSKLVWLSVPLLALAGLGIWKVTRGDEAAPIAPAAAAAPAPVNAPAPVPAPAIPAVRVAGSEVPTVVEPTAEPAAAPVAAAEPVAAPTKKAAKRAVAAKADTPVELPARAPAAAPVPPPAADATPAAAPVVVPPPAPAPSPPPVAVPTPPAPPAPEQIELQMAILSNATVSAIAADHGSQLAACEGSAGLHGDVAVTFQIDGTGKVVKSQLSSSIKNPKVAGCILKAVQSWKFPKPPSGAAKGVYTISYQ